MDIKVRNVDKHIVRKIDDMAKGKKLSRNKFVKMQLETLSVLDEMRSIQEKYETLVLAVIKVVEHNTEELARFQKFLEEELER